jgi:SPP1 gp7 family putative phage head morphogenesis protein
MKYWIERIQRAQELAMAKSVKAAQTQFKKYYSSAMTKTLDDFEKTYNKILLNIEEGKEPTPADLYKLDKYWQMQAQLRRELEKLGDKQISMLSKIFEANFFEVYYSIDIPKVAEPTFTTIDKALVAQMVNSVWVADGKTWSDRVWDNTKRLQQTLNEELIHCLVTGKKSTELKQLLQERFNVSYRRAETLVRTEIAHIQTEASKQRYKDYGIKQVEVLVDPDHKTCDKCKALIGKKFNVNDTPPLPVHPNERCCLVPVIN